MESTITTTTLAPHESDWRAVLSSRQTKRAAGVLTPHSGKSALYAGPLLLDPAIDADHMAAMAVISTPTPDRSGDVVEPLGARLANYARNPVVYFDHGLSGITLPIGKSENESGDLTVTVTPGGIEATSYFAQSLCEACQIFELIQQKIVRCASINLMPLVAQVRGDGAGPRPGLHIEEWELLEWSWVGIPDNPEAVRKILDTGRLAGSPICEPIRKCLVPFAAPHAVLGRGFSPHDQTCEEAGRTVRAEAAQAEQVPPIVSPPSDGEPANAEAADADAAWMHGSAILPRTFNGLAALAADLEEELGPAEPEEIRAFCKDLAGALRGAQFEVEACYRTCYGGRRLPVAGGSNGKRPSAEGDRTDERNPIAMGDPSPPEPEWIGPINDRLELIERKMAAAAEMLLEAIPHRRP